MRRPRLIVFLRAPRYGGVKTRLARDVGALAAWRFYRATASRTVRRLADRRWRIVLAVTPDRARTRAWPAAGLRVGQGPGDLGRRMFRALAAHAPAVLVGGDIPALDKPHVAAAFRAMRAGAPFVFGPAEDGGFWLVGVRRRPPRGLFAGVRWSSPHALADTLANLPPTARAALVAQLADVDDGAAYRALARQARIAFSPERPRM